ncbi:3-keto-disaccharide hydrolase, partial [Alistipes shahii]|uniref:3-keto-disaccharide hydrolase n=1 Tax=Alistipes shahii TaxID=328814 RepID=UPI002675E465
AKNPALGGETVAAALKKAQEVYAELAKSDADAGYAVDEIKGLLAKLPAEGFVPASLAPEAWKAVAGDPNARRAMKPKALAKAQQEADAAAAGTWNAADGVLTGATGTPTLGSAKEYENFCLIVEWKTDGEAGLGIRSIPQIALGGRNAGALTGNMLHDNAAPKAAANGPQEWNTMEVRVVNDRVTVVLNGITTCNNVILENTCNREIPAYTEGQILLVGGTAPVSFREMYVRELPPTPRFELSPEEAAEGFEVLFDGTSMHKWTGNTTNYVPVDGTIYVTAQYGGSGNLYTKKEYGDFVLRFEFAFDREGVNNGIGIRTPMGVDAAYHGMEIQVLDHDAPIYKNLRVYQQHGSVYGIIPAKRVKFPPLGTWNVEEIRAVGDRITVTVNGEVILDGDIRQACQGHNVAPDGGKNNPYTVDHKNHPGLFNASGHIGLLGHGAGIKFRNIRIKELPAAKTKK